MGYDESDLPLLSKTSSRIMDIRTKKFSGNRSVNALLYGLICGFVCSLIVSYSGLIDDDGNINFDYQLQNVNVAKSDVTKNLADLLYSEVRVLCAVMTDSSKLNETGHIIMDTWGKRCNKILFFSEAQPDRKVENVIVLKSNDGPQRVREAFEYIYENHLHEFDWILKTGKNAFIILENLRHLCYQYKTTWPIAIGQRFLKDEFKTEYVLSKKSLKLLVKKAFQDEENCNTKSGYADVEMSRCMASVNILKVESVDEKGRAMFFDDNPEKSLFPAKTEEYDTNYRFKLRQGLENCCSDRLVSLGNYWGTHLYYYEYFIYKVHAFGRHRLPEPLPKKKLSLDQVIKEND